MMTLNQKQIWLINFDPSFGHEYKKMRPALIIQDNRYIHDGNLITVLPISSIIEKPMGLDVFLPRDSDNRLMKDSLIKTHQISSFDKRRFIKYIGVCDSIIFENVKENIKKYLTLNEKQDVE
jgi:mRNA interferase MazF